MDDSHLPFYVHETAPAFVPFTVLVNHVFGALVGYAFWPETYLRLLVDYRIIYPVVFRPVLLQFLVQVSASERCSYHDYPASLRLQCGQPGCPAERDEKLEVLLNKLFDCSDEGSRLLVRVADQEYAYFRVAKYLIQWQEDAETGAFSMVSRSFQEKLEVSGQLVPVKMERLVHITQILC